MNEDVRICGAGLAGATIARLSAEAGYSVCVVERRGRIGGQCYDEEMCGVLVHQYGPHYFRTNSPQVMAFLSRFTDWLYYPCVAKVQVGEKLLPFPVNMTTVEGLYGEWVSYEDMVGLDLSKCYASQPKNAREVIIRTMGTCIYGAIYEGYTRKQWGKDASELDPSLATRYPIRKNREESYYYGYRWHDLLPSEGYTAMIDQMLDHPRIDVELYRRCKHQAGGVLVWTGPLDEYWGYQLGPLPYRSLVFGFQPCEYKQFPCLQVNYPDPSIPYTRIVEYDGFGRGDGKVVRATEFPSATGDPYYPIPSPDSQALAEQYKALESDTIFCGRLAEYQYLYMDETVMHAFSAFERIKERMCT